MELTCNVWADANFGRGTVEIRCTVIGEHRQHVCSVLMRDPEREEVNHSDPSRRNVFDVGGQ